MRKNKKSLRTYRNAIIFFCAMTCGAYWQNSCGAMPSLKDEEEKLKISIVEKLRSNAQKVISARVASIEDMRRVEEVKSAYECIKDGCGGQLREGFCGVNRPRFVPPCAPGEGGGWGGCHDADHTFCNRWYDKIEYCDGCRVTRDLWLCSPFRQRLRDWDFWVETWKKNISEDWNYVPEGSTLENELVWLMGIGVSDSVEKVSAIMARFESIISSPGFMMPLKLEGGSFYVRRYQERAREAQSSK